MVPGSHLTCKMRMPEHDCAFDEASRRQENKRTTHAEAAVMSLPAPDVMTLREPIIQNEQAPAPADDADLSPSTGSLAAGHV